MIYLDDILEGSLHASPIISKFSNNIPSKVGKKGHVSKPSLAVCHCTMWFELTGRKNMAYLLGMHDNIGTTSVSADKSFKT